MDLVIDRLMEQPCIVDYKRLSPLILGLLMMFLFVKAFMPLSFNNIIGFQFLCSQIRTIQNHTGGKYMYKIIVRRTPVPRDEYLPRLSELSTFATSNHRLLMTFFFITLTLIPFFNTTCISDL